MAKLVLVEASGKCDLLRRQLKAIGIDAEVLPTVGHVFENPRALTPIALDPALKETLYRPKEDRLQLLEKLRRAASTADRIYLATDDDQEGDVIAYDLAWVLGDHRDKLQRVRLRALCESEVRAAFSASPDPDLAGSACAGICRRIVDRAIGATFTKVTDTELIPVGRVQSSLLGHLAVELPEIGRFVMQARVQGGTTYSADVPVRRSEEIEHLEEIAAALAAGGSARFRIRDLGESDESVGKPWGFEEIVAEASQRLHISVSSASAALQDAYERGKVSYPRVRRNGFTEDAVEIAAALARQNRAQFDPALVPRRAAAMYRHTPHESPRPMDDEMQLGRVLHILDPADAVAVLVARNLIECGQTERRRKLALEVDGAEYAFSAPVGRPLRSWKKAEESVGFHRYPPDYAMLRYMAQHELGRPSTIVSHVTRFLKREVVSGDGKHMGLNEKGRRWLDHARSVGLDKDSANRMEAMFAAAEGDASIAARAILSQEHLLPAVEAEIRRQEVGRLGNQHLDM